MRQLYMEPAFIAFTNNFRTRHCHTKSRVPRFRWPARTALIRSLFGLLLRCLMASQRSVAVGLCLLQLFTSLVTERNQTMTTTSDNYAKSTRKSLSQASFNTTIDNLIFSTLDLDDHRATKLQHSAEQSSWALQLRSPRPCHVGIATIFCARPRHAGPFTVIIIIIILLLLTVVVYYC